MKNCIQLSWACAHTTLWSSTLNSWKFFKHFWNPEYLSVLHISHLIACMWTLNYVHWCSRLCVYHAASLQWLLRELAIILHVSCENITPNPGCRTWLVSNWKSRHCCTLQDSNTTCFKEQSTGYEKLFVRRGGEKEAASMVDVVLLGVHNFFLWGVHVLF